MTEKKTPQRPGTTDRGGKQSDEQGHRPDPGQPSAEPGQRADDASDAAGRAQQVSADPAAIAREDSARAATKPAAARSAFEAEQAHKLDVSHDVNDPERVRRLIADYKREHGMPADAA